MLPFVHLLSSGLTASIALGRELLATRADSSNPLALGFAQKANLTGFKASTSANYLTRACQRNANVREAGGVLSYVEVPSFCIRFRNSSFTPFFLSPSPSGSDPPALCHPHFPRPCFAILQPRRRCLCPTAAEHAKRIP